MEIQLWLMIVFAVAELSSCHYYFSVWRQQQSTLANFSVTWRTTARAWFLPYWLLFAVVLLFQSWRHLCGRRDSVVLVNSWHSRLWLVYALRLLGKLIRDQMTDCWLVNIPSSSLLSDSDSLTLVLTSCIKISPMQIALAVDSSKLCLEWPTWNPTPQKLFFVQERSSALLCKGYHFHLSTSGLRHSWEVKQSRGQWFDSLCKLIVLIHSWQCHFLKPVYPIQG